MAKLLGKKIRMTQVYKDEILVPASVIQLDPESDVEGIEIDSLVRVSGTSKGKGFQGVVKRHGFGGGPKSHGQKDRLRAPGSIGATTAQRVVPGRKMAGRMGSDRITIKNLKVVDVDKKSKRLLLKGAVPGNKNSQLEILIS